MTTQPSEQPTPWTKAGKALLDLLYEEEAERLDIAKENLMTISSIDAPIVLREQIEADGSISRVEAWLATDGDESQHQIVVSESDTRLSWGGILRLGYDLNGELVRLVVDNYGTEIEGARGAGAAARHTGISVPPSC